MNTRGWMIVAISGMLLAACGSAPLSTMMHGASFNEHNYGFVDARALAVKIALPHGFTLDAANTTLTAYVDSTTGSRKSELALEPLRTTEGKRASGMISSKEVDVTVFELHLTEESVKSIREWQRMVAVEKVKNVALEVRVKIAQAPEGVAAVQVWIEIMMSPMEGYVTAVNGSTIPVKP